MVNEPYRLQDGWSRAILHSQLPPAELLRFLSRFTRPINLHLYSLILELQLIKGAHPTHGAEREAKNAVE